MRFFTRMIVCSAAAVLLSAVFFHFANAWFGQDTNVLGAGRRIVFETRRSQALHARADMIRCSLELKRDITARLLDGSLSFRQAMAQFQKANEFVENVDLDLIPAYRAPTNPEGVARQVFTWARNAVFNWPREKSQHLLVGFEKEFHAMFGASAIIGVEYGVRPTDLDSDDRTETDSAAW